MTMTEKDRLLSIGEVAEGSGVPATTLRYYEQVGLLTPAAREGGRRRYRSAVLARLQVIGLCKAAGFSLEEILVLYADDAPGRPASRELAQVKIKAIDAQMADLQHARAIIEWGMTCTCPSIDTCRCGVHGPEGGLPA